MTIARDVRSESGFEQSATRSIERDVTGSFAGGLVPLTIRAERLARQVASFERAGYRLETHSAVQAIVAKPRERSVLRSALLVVATAGLYAIPLAFGARTSYHRVAITVDAAGAVRLS